MQTQQETTLQIEFLETILAINDTNMLAEFTIDFLTNKFKLSNCIIKINKTQKTKVISQNQNTQYNDIQQTIQTQIAQMKAPITTKNLLQDFTFKDIKNREQLPQNIIAIPILQDKQITGNITLYSETNIEQQLEFFIWISSKISTILNRINTYHNIKHTASTDALTGMNNRTYFETLINKQINNSRNENQPTTLIMFDIDNFKTYNDTKGHAAGDTILKELGKLITAQTPKQYTSCRYGGEEFMIFLPQTKNDCAIEYAENLRTTIQKNLYITISIGIATCLNSTADSQTLTQEADNALYKAKNTGKNKSCQRIIIDKTIPVIDTEEANSIGKT